MESEQGRVLLAYFLRIQKKEPSMMAHTSNLSARKEMVEQDLPTSLPSSVNAWLSERPCLKTRVDSPWGMTSKDVHMHMLTYAQIFKHTHTQHTWSNIHKRRLENGLVDMNVSCLWKWISLVQNTHDRWLTSTSNFPPRDPLSLQYSTCT